MSHGSNLLCQLALKDVFIYSTAKILVVNTTFNIAIDKKDFGRVLHKKGVERADFQSPKKFLIEQEKLL